MVFTIRCISDDEKKKKQQAAEALAQLKTKPVVHGSIERPVAPKARDYKRGGKTEKEKKEEVHTSDTTEDEE
ncbi:hypothetical protein IFR04_008682 [Cadophora malorum]|uniref:Uncharacterized protein n=1 Tax=Cadophora malorum TaxID=108018 RepID=A0A8H7TFY1_9HELO|nr:hypothetical protein IFR04_008682 [Cadophora malorum]